MIYSDNTYDITNNIATYTRRDFKSVFDTTSNKWYMLNNLNNYEEYGIYGDSFDTYYQGKLVIVNDHEYEWNGTEWDDLGEYVEVVSAVVRDAQHTGNLKFLQDILNIGSYKIDFKLSNGAGSGFVVAAKANGDAFYDTNDWRLFSTGTPSNTLYYDCGNGRYNSAYTANTRKNYLLGGSPMKITDLDTQTVIYNGATNHPNESGYLWFGGTSPNTDYGSIYDLVFYSDNEGQNAIAHYIPKIQNDTVGMYDTINDVFVAATGTMGAENGSVRPKDYPEKAAPTISTLWASTIYRNSAHLTTLMRNDAEQAKWSYMEDDILKKGEAPLPYKTNAYIKFSDSTSYSNSPRFETNIYLKNTYTIEIKLRTPISNYNNWRQIIGAYQNGLNSYEFALYTNTNNNYFGVNWWNYGSSGRLYNDSAFSMVANTEYIINIQVGTGETYINGILLTNKGGNNVNATLNKVLKICANDHTGDPGFNGQIYYIKITEGDNLIAYYEANNDNNIVGYLDKVSGTKIINVGGGTITYGED